MAAADAPRMRLGVSVVSAALPPCGQTFVKCTVGHLKEKSPRVLGSKPSYDFYASFEVDNAATQELTVAVMMPGPFGASALGHVTVPVSACAWKAGDAVPEPRAYPLVDVHGKPVKGAATVTLQLLLVSAPDVAQPLRVLVGTWNVGNEPPAADLAPWLRASSAGPDPDLVALGSQECTYTARAPHGSCDDDWVASCAAALGAGYVRVRNDALGQMRLVLFARADVRPGVTEHEAAAEATGLGHVHSNKGGVAAMLTVWDTSVCFVNSHLAAHQNKVKRRNEDYSEIVAGCEMGERGMDIMNQFHHLIWMGDLNYRLDLSDLFGEEAANAKTPPAALFDNINASVTGGQFGPLAACDQLSRARAKGDAFVGFQEGTLCHPPTFKVKRAPGLVYNTQRSPAYCDRVLWRSLPGLDTKQEALWAAPEVDSSDHKPVACVLALQRRPPRAPWVPRRPEAGAGAFAGVPRKSHASALHAAAHGKQLLTWRLQITALFGHGLMAADYNGKSDPYVAFLGVPLVKMAVTQVVFATLDPSWSIDKLPTLQLAAPSAAALADDYILVNVVDYDATSPDDPIGCGVLRCGELLQAAAASGGECDFEVPLTYAGLAQGSLSGRVRVSAGPPMPLAEMQAAKRRVKRIAPKKRFSLGRALGLKGAEPVIAVHVPHREGRTSETGSAARTSTASGRISATSARLSAVHGTPPKAAEAPAKEEEEEDDDDEEDD